MVRSVHEVFVCSEQSQLVPHAQLCKQRIDGAELNSSSATSVAKLCGSDVVFPVRLDEGECFESFDDPNSSFRAGESLEEFLEDETCDYDDVVAEQSLAQRLDLRHLGLHIAPQTERPDARVHEQAHERLRSVL